MKNLIDNIKSSEGYSSELYLDDKGIATIGYGTNITTISKAEAEWLLHNRIRNSIAEVDGLLGTNIILALNDTQKNALYELGYWIGINRFKKFKKMIKALSKKDYNKASMELLDSKIGRNYTTRATRLANDLKGE